MSNYIATVSILKNNERIYKTVFLRSVRDMDTDERYLESVLSSIKDSIWETPESIIYLKKLT